jgi:hypothetical protein
VSDIGIHQFQCCWRGVNLIAWDPYYPTLKASNIVAESPLLLHLFLNYCRPWILSYVWPFILFILKKKKLQKLTYKWGGFIYPPIKTYCSVKHLQVLSFFIFSLVLLTITRGSHVSTKHDTWSRGTHPTWRSWWLKLMTHGLEALIQRDGLTMTAQIVGLHLAKIVGSHWATIWHKHATTVDQWICGYMNCFVDKWLSHVMVNMTSGYKWESEKFKTCKCLIEQKVFVGGQMKTPSFVSEFLQFIILKIYYIFYYNLFYYKKNSNTTYNFIYLN